MAAPRARFLSASAVFLVLSLLGIVTGAILRWGADEPDAANLVWGITTAIGLVPIAWEVLSGILHRRPGVDLIAVLAMAGALALGEYLAGAVIAFMPGTSSGCRRSTQPAGSASHSSGVYPRMRSTAGLTYRNLPGPSLVGSASSM